MPRSTNWPRAAERLATRIPRDSLHPAVVAWAESAARGNWAVAFSGGADSLALLLVLWAHWPERRRTLRALHFDHRLRGRASAADARFCQKVCAALGVRFQLGEWSERRACASEAEAREARFAFFHDAQRRLRAPILWLGHQQDDIAETLLMRIARGSGTRGLAAPRPVQEMPKGRVHVRPLLMWRKAALSDALEAEDVPWREDASNATGEFFRNRVRQSVIAPWTDAAGRDAIAGAALTRELLQEDDDALEAWIDRLSPFDREGRLDVAALHTFPRGIQRRALHRWLMTLADSGDLSRQGFEVLLAKIAAGTPTRFSLGRSGFAVIRRGLLSFVGVTSK